MKYRPWAWYGCKLMDTLKIDPGHYLFSCFLDGVS
jgi:hypothetical protein